jgi:hypothetical protein
VDEVSSTRHDAVLGCVDATAKAWQDNIMPALANPITFLGGHYLDLDSLGGVSGDFGPHAGSPIAGAFSPQMASPNNAYLVTKHTPHTRRQRSGRTYLPGVSETNVDTAGIIDSGTQTYINGKLSSFLSALNNVASVTHPATTAWRVVHIVGYDGVPAPGYPNGRPNAWNSTDVSSATVDPKVATQRRRLR